jgi:mannose-6-phosphate isomerase-like protein (cupin superfamily)
LADAVRFTLVVEIFEPGGRTPPNTHSMAEEAFFVLRGEGVAHADGASHALAAGDTLVLRPGVEHVVENTGPGKLYCLTFMAPNEGFAELIRGGTPVALAPVRVGRATVRAMGTVMAPETALVMARATARLAKVRVATARTARRATPATPATPDFHGTMTAPWPMKTSPRAPMMRVRTRTATRWPIRP